MRVPGPPGYTADAVWRVAWHGAAGRGPGSGSLALGGGIRDGARSWEQGLRGPAFSGRAHPASLSDVSHGCTGPAMRATVRGCGWKWPRARPRGCRTLRPGTRTPGCKNTHRSASVRAGEGRSASAERKPDRGHAGFVVGHSLFLGVCWEIVLTRGQGEEAGSDRQLLWGENKAGSSSRWERAGEMRRDCDPVMGGSSPAAWDRI